MRGEIDAPCGSVVLFISPRAGPSVVRGLFMQALRAVRARVCRVRGCYFGFGVYVRVGIWVIFGRFLGGGVIGGGWFYRLDCLVPCVIFRIEDHPEVGLSFNIKLQEFYLCK